MSEILESLPRRPNVFTVSSCFRDFLFVGVSWHVWKKGMFTLELCSWFLEIPNEPIYYSVNF